MSQQTQTDAYTDLGAWLIGTAKRNPEALLVLGAGCALLMRKSGGFAERVAHRRQDDEPDFDRSAPKWRNHLNDAANTVVGGAVDLKSRAVSAVSEYASSASDYLEDTSRAVSDQSRYVSGRAQDAFQQGLGEVLRRQPLAIAAAGIASGAAIAALFPRLRFEAEALGPARDVVLSVAASAKDIVVNAAVEAGHDLKDRAADRGMSAEGLRDLTREAAETFKSKVNASSGPKDEIGGSGVEETSSETARSE